MPNDNLPPWEQGPTAPKSPTTPQTTPADVQAASTPQQPAYPQQPQHAQPAQHPQGAQPHPQQQYTSHQQQAPQPQYAPQQYQQPMPYGPGYDLPPPPKKSGMATWVIVLIVCAVLAIPVFGILAIAAIPLITTNTRDARRAEGEQLLGTCKNQVRAHFSKTLTVPYSLTQAGVGPDMRQGLYYKVGDGITPEGSTGLSSGYYGDKDYGTASLTCAPIKDPSDGVGKMTFDWTSGSSHVEWDPK